MFALSHALILRNTRPPTSLHQRTVRIQISGETCRGRPTSFVILQKDNDRLLAATLAYVMASTPEIINTEKRDPHSLSQAQQQPAGPNTWTVTGALAGAGHRALAETGTPACFCTKKVQLWNTQWEKETGLPYWSSGRFMSWFQKRIHSKFWGPNRRWLPPCT